jgi:hypothetical protein
MQPPIANSHVPELAVNIAAHLLFPLFIICLAAGLVSSHLASWRQLKGQSLDPLEYAYRRSQFRRRMQTSGLLILTGVGLFAGQWIPWQRWPSLYVFYWSGIVLLVVWVLLLAAGDVLAARAYVRRLGLRHQIERSRLESQVNRAKDASTRERAPPASRGNAH